MKTKLSITEVYRLDTELEVEQFISDERVKADKEGYELKGYKSAKKEKKAKRGGGIEEETLELPFALDGGCSCMSGGCDFF